MVNRRTRLLLDAARCYAAAGAHADAARCYDAAGRRWTAADAYQRAGDLEHAAETYRRAGHAEQAARCYRLLGMPDRAALCWREQDRPLEAAWELLLADRAAPAAELLAAVPAPPGGQRLRHELARAWCERLARGPDAPPGPLLAVLGRVGTRLRSVASRGERLLLLEWGVEVADRLARFDISAGLFAAAHRATASEGSEAHRSGAEPDPVLGQWHEWAARRLGGRAWLPPLSAAGPADEE